MAQQQASARLTEEGWISQLLFFVIYVAAVFISTTVSGLPIRGPDLNSCTPVIPPKRTAADAVECCFIDTKRPIKNFKFNLDLPVRVRRPAHKLDNGFVRQYERAVELMKALPPEDPRSFHAQAQLHCSYCAGAYNQFNTSEGLNVHMCWLDLPFHRWYVYFHERILASLLGDDTFAIPYWAWDVQNEHNPAANSIPAIFTNRNSSLYHEHRSKLHQPPHRADLNYHGIGERDPAVLLRENYYEMWATMIGHVQSTEAFYGGKYSQGDAWNTSRTGEFEGGPHAAIHWWTGDGDRGMAEDMGPAFSAARDPIFFAHHSNIDRLWLMWKSWGGRDYDDPDWLDSEFLFYDENADLVRVNVRDSLNSDNFRISYEQVEADWSNHTPKSIRDMDSKYARANGLGRFWLEAVTGGFYGKFAIALAEFLQRAPNGVKISLGGARRSTATARVSRREVLGRTEASPLFDEVLVISGVVEKPFDVDVLVYVFLELSEADEHTPRHCVEFLGAVRVAAEGLAAGNHPTVTRVFIKTIGIGSTLRILGITRQKSVSVTLVPAWDPEHDPDVSVGVKDLIVEMKPAK